MSDVNTTEPYVHCTVCIASLACVKSEYLLERFWKTKFATRCIVCSVYLMHGPRILYSGESTV
jgi:hypothetical protein